MTKIISVGNMKGGVGKTTTAVNLAQQLGKRGRTWLLDADEELQSAVFWRQGQYEGWTFEAAPFRDATPEQMANYDYVVLDTRGNEKGGDLVNLAKESDLLVIPTKPDGMSTAGLIRTLSPLLEAGVTNYRVLIVANIGGRGDELREALAGEGVPVMTTVVRNSTAVGDAAEKQLPLEAYTTNRYAKLVALDYASVTREVLSDVAGSDKQPRFGMLRGVREAAGQQQVEAVPAPAVSSLLSAQDVKDDATQEPFSTTLSRGMKRKLKKASADEGRKQYLLVEEALTEYLQKHHPDVR